MKARHPKGLKANPNWNLEIIKRVHPYKSQSDVDRRLNAGRKAGLPDKPPLPPASATRAATKSPPS